MPEYILRETKAKTAATANPTCEHSCGVVSIEVPLQLTGAPNLCGAGAVSRLATQALSRAMMMAPGAGYPQAVTDT